MFRTLTPQTPSTYIHGTNRQAAAANASSIVNLNPGAGGTVYLLSYIFWVGQAAAGGVVSATIAGLQTLFGNTVTLDLTWTTTQGDRIVFSSAVPLIGLVGTTVAFTIPATGAAGPACGVDAWGFIV